LELWRITENTSERTRTIEIASNNMLKAQTSAALVETTPEIVILKIMVLDPK